MYLSELLDYFQEIWPLDSADDWDRPGLSVGSSEQRVSKALLSVDITKAVVEEAISVGADLIVSHHPLLLRGVNEVTEQSLKGQIITLAIKNDIAIFSAHTNCDKAELGTARALANLFEINDVQVLDPLTGHGLIGKLHPAMTLLSFATKIAKLLPPVAAGLKVAGDPQQLVTKVALSPGAGDSDLGKALEAGADLFITSDLRHHPAQDFIETPGKPRALIDISHWASESVYLDATQAAISERFSELSVLVSEVRTDPWDFAVMQ